MAMHLREQLSNRWDHVQTFLFPYLRDEVGPTTPLHQRVAFVFDFAAFEACIKTFEGLPGRPLKDRFALARAFVAKAVMNISTTTGLIERLDADATLRRLCGWERAYAVPSESTFSRAFAEFAMSGFAKAASLTRQSRPGFVAVPSGLSVWTMLRSSKQ
jgi:hypothetical protein